MFFFNFLSGCFAFGRAALAHVLTFQQVFFSQWLMFLIRLWDMVVKIWEFEPFLLQYDDGKLMSTHAQIRASGNVMSNTQFQRRKTS